jgi:PAS domain S-box-containing protein
VSSPSTPAQRARELAAIVEESEDAILSKGLDGVIRSWNAAAERLYGYTEAEAVGSPILIIVPDDRHAETADIIRRIAAGERVRHYETLRRRKDGSSVDVSLAVSPVRDQDGRIVAASVIARDVTERRIADARRSAILEASLDAIVTMDRHGIIVEFNRAAERTFGHRSEDVIGRPVAETLIPAGQRDAHHRGLARYLATGRGPLIGRTVTVTAMRADGSELPAEIAIAPLELGGDMLFTASIRDVSDRRRAEAALVESEQHRRSILASMLQAEDSERSRIATELHDDTVQVMTASLFAMDRAALVARRTGDPRLESALAVARATLEEATDRTRRLMFELRPAVLHEAGLGAAIRVLADQAAREVDARADVRDDIGRYDHAVEELVYRSAQEVLANVRKHARPATITITLREDERQLVSEIADDGCGFDVDDVRARPRAALHLGLDSLGERVRAAGGDLDIASTPGTGTRVRFTVPLAAPEPVGGARPGWPLPD